MTTIKLRGGDEIMDTKMLVGWLVALGAVNWGLVGLLNLNVVEMILGAGSLLTRVVYVVIGVAGVWKVYNMTMAKK